MTVNGIGKLTQGCPIKIRLNFEQIKRKPAAIVIDFLLNAKPNEIAYRFRKHHLENLQKSGEIGANLIFKCR